MHLSEIKSLIKQTLIEEGISVTPEGKVDYDFAKNRDEDVLWFTKLNKEANIKRFTKQNPIDIYYGFTYRRVEDIAKTTHLGTSIKKDEKTIENDIRIVRSELKHFKTPEAEKAVSFLLDYALDIFEKTHPLDSFNLIISPRSSGEINGMIYSKIKKRLKNSNTVLGFDTFVKNTISKMTVLYDKIADIKNEKTREFITSRIDRYLKNGDEDISLSSLPKSVQDYITNVFDFSSQEDALKIGLAIRGGKILIVDDSFSEGKTLREIQTKLLELDEPVGATFVAWVPFRNYHDNNVADKNQEMNRRDAIVRLSSMSDEDMKNSIERVNSTRSAMDNRIRSRSKQKSGVGKLQRKGSISNYRENNKERIRLKGLFDSLNDQIIPFISTVMNNMKDRYSDADYSNLYSDTLKKFNNLKKDVETIKSKFASNVIQRIDDPMTKGTSIGDRKPSFSLEEFKDIVDNLKEQEKELRNNIDKLKMYGMSEQEKIKVERRKIVRKTEKDHVKELESELNRLSVESDYDSKKRVEKIRNESIPNALKKIENAKKELEEFDRIHGTGVQGKRIKPRRPVNESLSLRSILKNILKENIDAFKQDMDSDMRGKIMSIKHSDYAKGDELYTITGAPITFVSDLLPDKKTKEQRVHVKFKDGSSGSMYLKHVLPESPSKEQALSFMASKYKTYEEFVDASARRGYDESDNLRQIWDNSKIV